MINGGMFAATEKNNDIACSYTIHTYILKTRMKIMLRCHGPSQSNGRTNNYIKLAFYDKYSKKEAEGI
jgi:hypothetical protein